MNRSNICVKWDGRQARWWRRNRSGVGCLLPSKMIPDWRKSGSDIIGPRKGGRIDRRKSFAYAEPLYWWELKLG